MTGKVSIKATWHSTRNNHRHLMKSSLLVVYTGPEIYFTAELNAGVQYICTMAVRSRTVLERVFAIYSGILNTSKPFKFICQRNLSQAQATDAKKLRAMVNVFVLLCRCFSWSSSYFSLRRRRSKPSVLSLSMLSISVFKRLILSILIEKYIKHKKHNHSISQHTYRLLVQLRMEKKRVTVGKFMIIDFYRLL